MAEFTSLWDTGATVCMVSQAVVHACGLVEVGVAAVSHAMGTSEHVAMYYITLRLPSGVEFEAVQAIKGALPEDLQVVIGMNIINTGDFAVTNVRGRTKFTFRVLSQPTSTLWRKTRRRAERHPRGRFLKHPT